MTNDNYKAIIENDVVYDTTTRLYSLNIHIDLYRLNVFYELLSKYYEVIKTMFYGNDVTIYLKRKLTC